MKSAEELEKEGRVIYNYGGVVPFIFKRQVTRFVEMQVPFIVVTDKIPTRESDP